MLGLVLEGGGAKGAYHIGVYKAIKELGIKIDGITGTSVGALNGAIIAQDDLEKAYDLWYNMTYSRVIDIEDEQIKKIKEHEINKNDIFYLMKRIKEIIENKGLNVTPLRKLLEKVIDEEKIRKSGIDFGIVTVSLSDLKPLYLFIEDIPKGKLNNYLMASAYFPAFKSEKMDGKLYLDGGIYDNLPIGMLSQKGYKEIIAVRTYGLGRIKKVRDKNLNITYISPMEDLGRTLEFEKNNSRKNLKLGYLDALKVFKGLKGRQYYIESKENKDYFINFLLNLGEKKILKIGKILGITEVPYKRALFEFIIPKLNDLLDIKEDKDYEDIVLMFYEELAREYSMDRFKVYTYDDFTDEVMKKHNLNRKKSSSIFPNFIKHSNLFSKIAKSEIIGEILSIMFGKVENN